jgi:hypothetical protein
MSETKPIKFDIFKVQFAAGKHSEFNLHHRLKVSKVRTNNFYMHMALQQIIVWRTESRLNPVGILQLYYMFRNGKKY